MQELHVTCMSVDKGMIVSRSFCVSSDMNLLQKLSLTRSLRIIFVNLDGGCALKISREERQFQANERTATDAGTAPHTLYNGQPTADDSPSQA